MQNAGSRRYPAVPKGVASDEMCVFLILNISSLQLIPMNVVAYRSQYGSVNPTAIVGPAILATAVSTLAGVIYSYLLESVISRFPIIVIDENTYAAIKDYPKTDLLAKKDKNDRYYLNIFAPLQSEFFMEFRDETFTSQKIDMDQVLKNIIQNRKKFKYDANNYEKYGFLIEEYQKYIEMMNIITESLYDKPVVVFREYVQNAADSFFKSMNCVIEKDDLFCKVWHEKECLFFLDNGNGIIENQFQDEMRHIAWSV